MAKRRAGTQIWQSRPNEESNSESEGDEQTQQSTTAEPSVIAKRKIAVPRSRLSKPAGSAAPAAASPFQSLVGSDSSTSATAPANPFGFLNSNAKPASAAPAAAPAAGTSTATTHTDSELKMRALNSAFAAQVAKANTASPFENWTQMCEKYISYAAKIASSPAPASTTTTTTTTEKKPETGKSQITSTGFKFGGSDISSASNYQFGDKKVDISKPAATAPSKPAGGFVFNANGSGAIVQAPSSAEDISGMKDDDDSDASAAKEEEEAESKPESKPAFSFGAAKDTKPAFSFGDSNKPAAFSFGNSASTESRPAFSFGAKPEQSSDKTSEPSKPAFSFGKPATENKSEESKPAFSFGKPESKPEEAKPAFSFGKKDDEPAKPAFSFGKKDEESAPKPAFSFGSTAAEKPKFSFGSNNAATTPAAPAADKPKFSFGSTGTGSTGTTSGTTEQPKFTFGNSGTAAAEKPKFTFGNDSSSSAEKPKFSFGSTNSESKFSFGAPNKPAISFGAGANPFGSAAQPNSNTPPANAAWTPGQPIKIASVDDQASKPEVGGEPSEEQNEPQADLGGPGPGEENEDSVYEKKSKIFELVKGEYKPLGLGNLRILVHKETKKARALVRAEGSGRVLLNIPIRKEFNYTTVGKGQVKVLDVKPGDDTPTIYVLRVKTEEDGEQLKSKLEEVKS